MKGKEIAANLRANRDRWTQSAYHYDGKYCVIGLKLHELGIPVEQWEDSKQFTGVHSLLVGSGLHVENLKELQRENDIVGSIQSLIDYCEANADRDYPLEALAEYLKSQQ